MGARVKSILNRLEQLQLEFTDVQLTGSAGLTFLTSAARHFGLLHALDGFEPCKVRDRGASDQANVWSLVACLASGRGTLRDLDDLRQDRATCHALGLAEVAGSRRMGEWLRRMQPAHIASLRAMATALAERLTPMIIAYEQERCGYVPLFLDGTAIEVAGERFEAAAQSYGDSEQYWMHAAFVGKLQVSGRLASGTTDSVGDWRTQLQEDIVPVMPNDTPVWVTMDNAYYRGELVKELERHGWSWSISVTNPNNKRPVLALVDDDAPWTPLPDSEDEDVYDVWHQPAEWERPVRYVIVRRLVQPSGDGELFPTYTVIATSNRRASLATVVTRHRAKQGWENGFKGPLREMDLHHPPTASFLGNQLYYTCGLLAQQLLVAIQYGMLPADAWSCGLRPLMRDVIGTVAKLTRSARRRCLAFGKSNPKLDWLLHACDVHDAWWRFAPG
jgi:hypothetical protein